MEYLKYFPFFLFLAASPLINAQQDNILFYQDSVQVTNEISPYANLTADQPIVGTLMVTHDSTLKVDPATFKIGNDPLKVEFVKEVPLSAEGKLVITIYKFELSGKKKGNYDLPPISVKVGEKEYQAPSLNINIE